MEVERQKERLVRVAHAAVMIALAVLGLYCAWKWLLPFLLGFLIAYLLRPAARFVQRHSRMGARGASIVPAVALYALLGVALWLLGLWAAEWLHRLAQELPGWYESTVQPLLREAGASMAELSRLGSGAGSVLSLVDKALGAVTSAVSQWGMELLGRLAAGLPLFAIGLVFTILSSVMICMDFETVTGFVLRQIPERLRPALLGVRDFMMRTLGRVILTYLMLMVITFAELALGLWLLKVEGFWWLAALVALLDLLPVLGSGAVLVPWAVWMLADGNHLTGWGMLALWGVISAVRQVLEPKILGDQIGLKPLAALTSMYVGLRVAGVGGLVVAPVLCLLLQYLHDNGILRLYK